MPATVERHTSPDHFRFVLSGRVGVPELQAAAAELLARVADTGLNLVLADARLREGGHGTLEIYEMAERLATDATDATARRVREAVLLPQSATMSAEVRFWETACLNRGLQVRVFGDADAAMAWLFAATAELGVPGSQDSV
jgi:hypothetical protein